MLSPNFNLIPFSCTQLKKTNKSESFRRLKITRLRSFLWLGLYLSRLCGPLAHYICDRAKITAKVSLRSTYCIMY